MGPKLPPSEHCFLVLGELNLLNLGPIEPEVQDPEDHEKLEKVERKHNTHVGGHSEEYELGIAQAFKSKLGSYPRKKEVKKRCSKGTCNKTHFQSSLKVILECTLVSFSPLFNSLACDVTQPKDGRSGGHLDLQRMTH